MEPVSAPWASPPPRLSASGSRRCSPGLPEELAHGGRHYEATTTPPRDRGGRETGRVVMLRDVTERRQAHQRLVRLDAQRRWLLGRLVTNQDQERHRLAVSLRRVMPKLGGVTSGRMKPR